MEALSHTDQFHLRAAEGWFELGLPSDAMQELEQISSEHQTHPDVLQVRWQVHAKQGNWEQAVKIATSITQNHPDWVFGWTHLAFALHELRRTQEAYDTLSPVLSRFPKDWLMRYNMACYACQLGRLDEARKWLEKACRLGNAQEIREMADQDKDLEPLS